MRSNDRSWASAASGGGAAPARVEVAVVGAGQAGLAVGYYLSQQDRDFVLLDRADAIGASWHSRWESLVLFTPRRHDALPGLSFPGDPDGYPTRDEVIAYLQQYATRFTLPIHLNSEVRAIERTDGRFLLRLAERSVEAEQVVVATGAFQEPHTPSLAGELSPEITQIHSAQYKRPADVPAGEVVVVGGGNTGYQIAGELADGSHRVHLAVGSRQKPLPQRILGRDLFWWLDKLGILAKSVDSRLGQRLRDRDTLVGSSPKDAKRRGIELHPRLIAAEGKTIRFEDGSVLEPKAIVWATGFRPEHSWIKLPIHDEEGRVQQERGVTSEPGLYFVGLSWQYTRGSALLGWVQHDAEFIAGQIAAHASSDTDKHTVERIG
jgi:putative flavoprotein involved in K+ transport